MTARDVELARGEVPRLRALGYRMTGSVAESEDLVQEALLRLGAATDVRDPAAWLTTVTTRLAIDHLRSARVERERYVGPWLPEPLPGHEPPDLVGDPEESALLAESVTNAMLLLLETLSPAERAVFVLHDVFGYRHDEVAAMLGRSAAAVRKLASRARGHVAAGRERFVPGDDGPEQAAQRFLQVVRGGDLDELMEVLSPEVRFVSDGGGVVSAARRPVVGRDRVARLVHGLLARAPDTRLDALVVNGAPGVVVRGSDGSPVATVAVAVDEAGLVGALYVVVNPVKLAHVDAGR